MRNIDPTGLTGYEKILVPVVPSESIFGFDPRKEKFLTRRSEFEMTFFEFFRTLLSFCHRISEEE